MDEQLVVVGGSGSNIGPNLNRTEPDAAFRFTVLAFAEPERQVRFSVRAERQRFERRT